jgi:hypothetical protein
LELPCLLEVRNLKDSKALDSTREHLERGSLQPIAEHVLDKAVDGVGPGLGVVVHEGVAVQRGEKFKKF